MNSQGESFLLYSTPHFEIDNFLVVPWDNEFVLYSCIFWGCVALAVPGLCSGSIISLFTLASFPVLPLPTHHKESKLSIRLTYFQGERQHNCSVYLFHLDAVCTWILFFEHSLIFSPSIDAFICILKVLEILFAFIGNSGLSSLLFWCFHILDHISNRYGFLHGWGKQVTFGLLQITVILLKTNQVWRAH